MNIACVENITRGVLIISKGTFIEGEKDANIISTFKVNLNILACKRTSFTWLEPKKQQNFFYNNLEHITKEKGTKESGIPFVVGPENSEVKVNSQV